MGGTASKWYKKYCNPLNEERDKQGYERTKRNDKHKEYRDNHKEEAKEYHKGYRDLEKAKTDLKQSKKKYYERDKFNILAKAKRQLKECDCVIVKKRWRISFNKA